MGRTNVRRAWTPVADESLLDVRHVLTPDLLPLPRHRHTREPAALRSDGCTCCIRLLNENQLPNSRHGVGRVSGSRAV